MKTIETQLEPEVFELMQNILNHYMENVTSKILTINIGLETNTKKPVIFLQKIGTTFLFIKNEYNEQKFIKGQWYTHTEPGQEKFLIRVEDPEKQICSGWDCKGNPFKNEWVHLGNRLNRIPNDVEHIDALNKLLESNFK